VADSQYSSARGTINTWAILLVARARTVSPVQELFSVFFSILYGIMLNACFGLSLFPFGQISCPKARDRTILSILIINFFPIVYFTPLFILLENYQNISFLQIYGVFFISLSVFIFHRIMIVIIRRYKRCLYCVFSLETLPNLKKRIE